MINEQKMYHGSNDQDVACGVGNGLLYILSNNWWIITTDHTDELGNNFILEDNYPK